MKKELSQNIVLFIKSYWQLFLLLLFHTLLFLTFQYLDHAYQTWDSAGHIALSFRMANEIKGIVSHVPNTSFTNLIKISNYYPPFVQLLGAFFSLLFGYSSKLLLIIPFVFFVVAIVFTYKIALALSTDKKLALFVAIIFSLFPQVVAQSRVFLLDIPLTALILVATYYLLISNNFRKAIPTLLFFLFAGLAQITKWYAFVYFVVPAGIIFVNLLWESLKARVFPAKALLAVVGGLVIAFLICFPWYFLNYKDLLALSSIFSQGEVDDPNILSFASITFYPVLIGTFQLLFLPTVFLVLGLIYFLFKKPKQGFSYLLYIFVPLAVFTLISNKNLRYILPLTPIFSYILVTFVFEIDKRFKIVKYITAGYLLVGTLFLSFNHLDVNSPLLKPLSFVFAGPNYIAWTKSTTSFDAYDPNYYAIGDILDFIYKDANKYGANPLGIANLSDSQKFSAATFEMLRLEKHMNNVYLPVPYFQFDNFASDYDMDSFLTNSGAEYVIVPNNPGPSGLRNYQALKQLSEYLTSNRNILYTLVKEFDFPESIKVYVYKRVGLEQTFVQPGECTSKAGFLDGIETIKLVPETTYIFFTGHFAIQDKILRNFAPGVIYIVQIENSVHTSTLDVHNLPRSGSSMCARSGLGLDLTSEIKIPLIEKNRCGEGVDCQKVILAKWSVGSSEVILKEFNRGDF